MKFQWIDTMKVYFLITSQFDVGWVAFLCDFLSDTDSWLELLFPLEMLSVWRHLFPAGWTKEKTWKGCPLLEVGQSLTLAFCGPDVRVGPRGLEAPEGNFSLWWAQDEDCA